MADKTIGELSVVKVGDLPLAPDIYDDTLIPVEQQGEALHMTGSQWVAYAQSAVGDYVGAAQDAAQDAQQSAANAAGSAKQAANSATAAAGSAEQAGASEAVVAENAAAAAQSAQAAKENATNAAASERHAADSEANATTSASAAQQSADDAALAKATAQTAQEAAQIAADRAEAARDSIVLDEEKMTQAVTDAVESATAAQNSAESAAASEGRAEYWSEQSRLNGTGATLADLEALQKQIDALAEQSTRFALHIGDTEPSENGVFWFNTAAGAKPEYISDILLQLGGEDDAELMVAVDGERYAVLNAAITDRDDPVMIEIY